MQEKVETPVQRSRIAGHEVEIRDETSAYGYSNLHRVRLRVSIRVPGVSQPLERVMERMGVASADLESARSELARGYLEQIAPYLSRPDFAQHFARHLVAAQPAPDRAVRYG